MNLQEKALDLVGYCLASSRKKAGKYWVICWGMNGFRALRRSDAAGLHYLRSEPWRLVGTYDRDSLDADLLAEDLEAFVKEEGKRL